MRADPRSRVETVPPRLRRGTALVRWVLATVLLAIVAFEGAALAGAARLGGEQQRAVRALAPRASVAPPRVELPGPFVPPAPAVALPALEPTRHEAVSLVPASVATSAPPRESLPRSPPSIQA